MKRALVFFAAAVISTAAMAEDGSPAIGTGLRSTYLGGGSGYSGPIVGGNSAYMGSGNSSGYAGGGLRNPFLGGTGGRTVTTGIQRLR